MNAAQAAATPVQPVYAAPPPAPVQAAPPPQPAPAPAPAPATPASDVPSYMAELQQLASLQAAGVLTAEEFEAKKRQI
ncbi:MAG: SHOCT domain-containing protein, partial [Acidimicrobiia bacterium]|nr:SHOCT domain-containing protein [Acidimicrobiia bacterium]